MLSFLPEMQQELNTMPSAAHFYNITIFLPPCCNPINLTVSPYCSYKTSPSNLLEFALLDLNAVLEWPSLLLSQKA